MSLLRAWITLIWLTVRRLIWSANTLMVVLPLAACGVFLFVWRHNMEPQEYADYARIFAQFSNVFVITIFSLFVIPVCALAYATTSIGGDREERTLLFLLIRPIPRAMVLAAKFLGTLPIVVSLIGGSFYGFCQIMPAPVADEALRLYLPSVVLMSIAYVSVFHLFAVLFRHSTIIALVYSLSMETILGAMPGIIKRLAVNFYGRSMMYDLARDFGVQEPLFFQAIDTVSAQTMLAVFTIGSMSLATIVFVRKEYRDLS
ncbi:MAG: ABC transporter permease [Pirellulales bacterium]|nr:ABC transporter permease [Pirellulales bacterium]